MIDTIPHYEILFKREQGHKRAPVEGEMTPKADFSPFQGGSSCFVTFGGDSMLLPYVPAGYFLGACIKGEPWAPPNIPMRSYFHENGIPGPHRAQ
jgi:hypothetical protein